jgi:hypothetical protein
VKLSILRRRPSPALVISMIALFMSLSGVSYGVATGFIDSREIKNNEIRSGDIRNNEVRTRDLRNNEVRGIDIRNSTVQGRDIALNTVTGEDVKEDTLGKVPSAAAADTATSAGGVDTLKIVPRTAMAKGDPDVVLATNGSLTLKGRCEDASGSARARLVVATTEDNTGVGATGAGTGTGNNLIETDLDGGETFVYTLTDGSAAGTALHITAPVASAPSGKGFTGQVVMMADGSGAGSCTFSGHLALQG